MFPLYLKCIVNKIPKINRKLEFSEINRAALLSGNTLPKPHPQRTSFGGFSMSPLSSPMAGAKRYAVKVGNSYQMSALPLAGLQSIVLPSAPVWTPASVQLGNSNFSDLIRSPINSLNMVKNVGSSTAFTHSSTNKPITTSSPKTINKHSVTNILGVSNKINTNQLNHRYSSPFQIVKKDSTTSPKLPLGSLHNIPGGFQ
uniref:Transcription factor n=1 Tax=Heterorhabditis bacteriophora TaxID=37862 RepID=A0A1I7WJB5_HETBA